MTKFFYITIVFFITLFLFFTPLTQGQTRYAECDLCGYCPNINPTPPQNWENCRECIYPTANQNFAEKDTLEIDPTTNIPPSPFPGHMNTMIGCIKTNLTDFTQEGAASSVVQKLLNFLFSIAGGISFIYLLYGSYLVTTSKADPTKLQQGKRIILGAIIGVIFAVGAVFIISFLASGILRIPGFS